MNNLAILQVVFFQKLITMWKTKCFYLFKSLKELSFSEFKFGRTKLRE